MLMVALFFDALGIVGLVPFVGTALTWAILAAADFTFFHWFKYKKVDFLSGKSLLGIAIATFVEIFFGALPAIFAQTVIIIMTSWTEDKIKPGSGGGAAAQLVTKAATKSAPQPKVPTQIPSI